MNANLLLVDRVFDSSNPAGPAHLHGYSRLDLNVVWLATNAVRLTFAIDNSLDDHYEEAVGFPSPERRARVTLRVDF